MKVLDFKTVSPLFEMERDGEKPFIARKFDPRDSRFRALSQWYPAYKWGLKITNPQTGESFIRKILDYEYIRDQDTYLLVQPNWVIIFLGERED